MPPGKKKEADEYIAEVSVISPNLDLSKVKELFENGNTPVSVRCILHNFIFLY